MSETGAGRGWAAGIVCGLALALAAAPSMAGDLAEGRAKARACQPCHGIDGIARRPDAPHIAGESALYLEKQLRAFRSGERQDEVMSLIAQMLSDEDIGDLAAWYSSIGISAELPQ